jgi:hypothetical protein
MPGPAEIRSIATSQRPYAAQAIETVTQQDIAGILEGIYDLMDSEIPDIFRQYSFSASDQTAIIDSSIVPTMPWIGVTICNGGPDPVYIFVNDKVNIREQRIVEGQTTNVAPIQMNERIKFGMKKSGIERIFMQCDPGNTATVRMYSEGKLWKRPTFVTGIEGQ